MYTLVRLPLVPMLLFSIVCPVCLINNAVLMCYKIIYDPIRRIKKGLTGSKKKKGRNCTTFSSTFFLSQLSNLNLPLFLEPQHRPVLGKVQSGQKWVESLSRVCVHSTNLSFCALGLINTLICAHMHAHTEMHTHIPLNSQRGLFFMV